MSPFWGEGVGAGSGRSCNAPSPNHGVDVSLAVVGVLQRSLSPPLCPELATESPSAFLSPLWERIRDTSG